MDVSNKRKEDSYANPLPNKIKKRPPPIRPYTTASLDDVAFKWTAADVQDHYRLETVLHPGHHLGFLKKYPHSAVFVQCTSAPPEQILNLKPVIHRNVVQLRRVYTKGDSVSMIYEMTIASLNDILSFRPHWSIAETAAICHSVLSALKYVHGSLGISHGDLGVRSLRLDWNGLVKIANIGESLLRGDHDYNKDIRDLGIIVKRIAEPNELKLPTLADFLHGVERGESASTLLQHEFLKNSNGPEQLEHCVNTWLATRIFVP